MKNFSVFDILGPVMIGPSSSHTAGAARLGKVARYIAGKNFKSVIFQLHGSFAKTYKGHGTDKALVAGILGMEPHDENLKDSIAIAKSKNINIKFMETDLGLVHPNTVRIIFEKTDDSVVQVTGSSVGGGNIIITDIDGYKLEFTGEYATLFIRHIDNKGVISKVTTILAQNNINIATMKVSRKDKGDVASMIIEADHQIPDDILKELSQIKDILSAKAINPVKEENNV